MKSAPFLCFLLLFGCDAAFTDLRPAEQQLAIDPADMGTTNEDPMLDGGTLETGVGEDASAGMETILAQGDFEPRADYGGEGTATLVQLAGGGWEVRLSDDFDIGSVPGPAVVLAREDSLGSTLDPARGDLELGVLQSNSGSSTYAVPQDPGDRRIVWIYCKPFGLQMAAAPMVAP